MKIVKRSVSLLLSLLFVLQLLPVQYLGAKTIQAFALGHYEVPETYNFEIPQETDNTIDTDVPETFIDKRTNKETTSKDIDLATDISDNGAILDNGESGSNEYETSTYSSSSEEIDCTSYAYSPYAYESNESEHISLSSGDLTYETTDYVLPGRNGFDLVFKRMYCLADATYYKFTIKRYNSPYRASASQRSNDHFNYIYGLGHGWSFAFTSIQKIGNLEVLHLSDGRTYTLMHSDYNPLILIGQGKDEIRVIYSTTTIEETGEEALYTIEYIDGRIEYLSSTGKLIYMTDPFGNRIKFRYALSSTSSTIYITDSLDQITTIYASKTDPERKVTITLPDGNVLTYNVESHESGLFGISSYTDPEGNITQYSYDINDIPVSEDYTTAANHKNFSIALSTITHPTNVQTKFEYEILAREPVHTIFTFFLRVTSRYDLEDTVEKNRVNYSYAYGGIDFYGTEMVATGSDYYIEAAYSSGLKIRNNFDDNDKNIERITSYNGKTIKKEEYGYKQCSRTYRVDDITRRMSYYEAYPSTVVTYLYNSDQMQYVKSIEKFEYDSYDRIKNSWSSYAEGDDDNTEYLTANTYEDRFLETQTFKTNSNTTVALNNTIWKDQYIKSSKINVNGAVVQTTDYTYDSYGNILTEKTYGTDSTSYELAEYTYENGVYLTQEKHSSGNSDDIVTYNYTYDASGRLATATDGNGNITSYSYDKLGNITRITNPDNTAVTYSRNYTDNYVVVTDENGAQIKYTYTPLGLEYETIDVLTGNVITRKEYDNCSRLVKVSEYIYGSVTEYEYDCLDRVTSETIKQGDDILYQTTYSYEYAVENGLYNKVTKTIVGDNYNPDITTSEYTDKHGNIVKTSRVLDGTEYFDTYTYDYVGNQTSVLTAADAAKSLAHTAKYEYNHNGQVTKTYNANNQYTTNVYDAFGKLVSATDYAGTPTTYTYETLGRLATQTATIENGVTSTAKYEYDGAGNIIREWKQNNAVGSSADWTKTEYTYDSRNRLTSVKQYNDSTVVSTTSYSYDGTGNVLTMTAGGKTTTHTYDRFGNVLTETDALNRTKSYTYSPLGKLESTTDKNGITTKYTYDALGRVSIIYAGTGENTETSMYAYTKTGKLAGQININMFESYRYDSLGRIINVIEETFPDYTEYSEKTYTYDLAGNRTGFTLEKDDETVHNITYTYDNLNRLSTVSENGNVEAAYTYDTNGNRASLTLGNGIVTTYSYNLANWVTNLSNKNARGEVFSSYDYTYYVSGNQKSKTDNDGVVTSYVYDDLGRLTSESESGGVTLNYIYDAAGNRTKLTASGTESYTVDYSYNAVNQLTSEVKTVGSTVKTTSYTYDNNGNMLSKTSPEGTQANTYNKQNQLVSSIAAGVTSSYTYTPDGIRFSKTVGNTTTNYLLDNGNVIGEVQNGDVTAKYLYGANLISRKTDSNPEYYIFNAHGDVVNLIDHAQVETMRPGYDYDAFGNEKNPSATDDNPFRYCAEYFDKETGTYYLRARYYDPSIGRFTQQDTHWNTANMIYGDNPNKINEREDALGLNTYTYMPSINSIMQSGNLYVYGLNNPVQYADASGEIAFLVVTGIAGAIIGAITGGIIATNNGTEWWKGALVGAGLGGLAGVTAGGMIAATTTGVATASFSNVLVSGANWATASSVALSTSSATIGRNFEKWFYEFNQISKQYQQIVMNGIGRIDAFKNGHIYELKNYNWEKYSTSQINNIAEKFLQQYNKYQSISEFLGEKVKGIVFYFSSKPPQEIIEKLTEAGAIVEWVSSIK